MEVLLSATDLILNRLSLPLEYTFYVFIWRNLTLLFKAGYWKWKSLPQSSGFCTDKWDPASRPSQCLVPAALPFSLYSPLHPSVWLCTELARTLPWWVFFTERNCSAKFITFLKDTSILLLGKKVKESLRRSDYFWKSNNWCSWFKSGGCSKWKYL